jgi:hypothetical protein
MAPWLRRIVTSPPFITLALVALGFPQACTYLRWPILVASIVISLRVVPRLIACRELIRLTRNRATRVAHGLEHGTAQILTDLGVPGVHGFTHGTDRFVIAVPDYGHDADAVRQAAASAIERIRSGERSLAYSPQCSTSMLVSQVSFWLVYMTCVVFSFVVVTSVPIFIATSIILFPIWFECEVAFGLLAQQLWTVSTAFTTARLVDVHRLDRVDRVAPPAEEVWFEIVVDIQLAATSGGWVAPY